MNVLLATFGTRGDVQPFLALAVGLIRAGHTVQFCGPPDAQARVEERGISFVAAGDPYDVVMAEMNASPVRAAGVIARQVPAQFSVLAPWVTWADIVVSGSLEYATATLCERARKPRRAVLCSPCFVPSSAHPMPFIPWYSLPKWLNAASWWLSDVAAGASLGKAINLERSRSGMAPIGRASLHLCGEEVLVPFPTTLCASSDGDVPVRQSGPWLLDEGELPAIVADFLGAGPPAIYFGMGSMPGPDDFPEIFSQAARILGKRAILADRSARVGAANVLNYAEELPHRTLFSRCAAIVHHGGAGTTISAAISGRAQLILPFVADQHFHAHLVGKLGIGKSHSRKGLTAPVLADTLRAVLALKMPPQLELSSGVDETIALLQALCSPTPA